MDDEQQIDLESFQQAVQEQYGVDNVAVGVGSTPEDTRNSVDSYLEDALDVSSNRITTKYFAPDLPADEYGDQLGLSSDLDSDDVGLVGLYTVDEPATTAPTTTAQETSPGAPGDVDDGYNGSSFSGDLL